MAAACVGFTHCCVVLLSDEERMCINAARLRGRASAVPQLFYQANACAQVMLAQPASQPVWCWRVEAAAA